MILSEHPERVAQSSGDGRGGTVDDASQPIRMEWVARGRVDPWPNGP